MYEEAADVLYKRERNRWKVFDRKKNQGRRFCQTSFSLDNIPEAGVPIQVIEGSGYLITVEMERHVPANSGSGRNNNMAVRAAPVSSIPGNYDIDENKLEEPKAQWNDPESWIIGAADGGLKDQKGTCSYAIFLPDDN